MSEPTAEAGIELPRVALLALGGTIASVPERAGSGAVPQLRAEDLLAAVPELAGVARLEPSQVAQVPSTDLTVAHMVQVVEEAGAAFASGAAGVVVTQGTDTLEETAFVLDLLHGGDGPIVVTGAMRTPGSAGADGPANLLAAARVAVAPRARGLGALVVMGDVVHAARFVRKTHAFLPSAFASPSLGPIGWVAEDRVRIGLRPPRAPSLTLAPGTPVPRVALWRVALGDDGALLDTLIDRGYQGLVIEGFGGGHVPRTAVGAVERLIDQIPVVLTSRTGAGEALRSTYGFVGSERYLLERGILHGGALDGLKARLLLTLLLAAGTSRAAIAARIAELGELVAGGPAS